MRPSEVNQRFFKWLHPYNQLSKLHRIRFGVKPDLAGRKPATGRVAAALPNAN
jgi:hypothetical protein